MKSKSKKNKKEVSDTEEKILESDNDQEEIPIELDQFDNMLSKTFLEKTGIEILDPSFYGTEEHNIDVIVPNEFRRTSNIMTKAEYARIIGERAKQIENGAPPFIQLKNEHDPSEIARREVREGVCPLSISRVLYSTQKGSLIEIWKSNEMVLPFGF